MQLLDDSTIDIDIFRLRQIMPSGTHGPIRDFDDIAQDDDLEYALELERRIQQSRSIYNCEVDSDPTDVNCSNNTPANDHKAATDTQSNTSAEQAVAVSLEDLLPDLDLGYLLDDTAPSTTIAANSIDDSHCHRENDVLLSDLDLYGLFDDEEDLSNDDTESPEHGLPYAGENGQISLAPENGADSSIDFEQLLNHDGMSDDDDTFWFGLDSDEVATSSDREVIDWRDYTIDADEYQDDIEPAAEYEVEIDTGLTREERALQAAIITARSFDLTINEILTLAEIYEMCGWSACKIAVERELENDTEIKELRLAADIKEVWHEHTEFYSSSPTHYQVLSWPAALSIIRSFDGYPSPEEVEILLERLFDHWYHDGIAHKINTQFGSYIIAKFNPEQADSALENEWKRELALHFDEDLFTPPSTRDLPINALQRDSHIHFSNIRRVS